ncbi:hypothetical protein [Blautia stercoris]
MRDELELAAVAVKENGTEYLSQLSSERYRLTWIENDGTVLYDTVTDAESLENHADRVEVKQALEYGEGESTRYSSTLLQKTMYCAERLADGSVLRISMSRATAGVLLVGMGQPILVVLIVALILSSVLAKSLSHRSVQPLNKLDLSIRLKMTPMKSSPAARAHQPPALADRRADGRTSAPADGIFADHKQHARRACAAR